MKKLELYFETGDLAGTRHAVPAAGLRFGRSSSNDIHCPDEELSRNHCLFEPAGENGIRVTDLASANGTFLNEVRLGVEPTELHAGDTLRAGTVRIRIVEEGAAVPQAPAPTRPEGPVDLGLGAAPAAAAAADAPSAKRRSPLANVLWVVVVLVVAAALYVILPDLFVPSAQQAVREVAVEPQTVLEMAYEKVDADAERVFRYALSLQGGGQLAVTVDDLPEENRHLSRSVALGPQALARLVEILSDPAFEQLDAEYTGPEETPPKLKSRSLKVVWSRHVKSVRCINAPVEPEAFARLRTRLEAFTKNELGIWAMGQSKAQLVALAAQSAENAAMKWNDRDVEHGNIFAAAKAYREAIFYLDTVNPKPTAFEGYRKALRTCETELETRYRDHRFKADRAINLADWDVARKELQVLLALVPDRDDDRYREASAKLMDVTRRLEKEARK